MKAVASLVADRVGAANAMVDFQSETTILMNERELEVGIRQPDVGQLEKAKALLAQAANPERLTMNEVYAQESVRLSQASPTVRIKLQTISIGELAIVTVPCEVFAKIGIDIKRRSPFKTTFLIGLANGYNGYLPSPEQHKLGGYETWRSSWSYLETDASTKITNSILNQLQQLRSDQQ